MLQADTRTAEEIARTAALHRPGVQRGLDDLPAMRQSLGTTPGTEKQRQRAQTYVGRLAVLETSLRGENWSALRHAAYAIEEQAADDYEDDEISGAAYSSITDQLAIVFRRVPEE
ncbi:hypothetical protein CFB39_37495 [Burkholderia sp. AU6039]|nr:hypothetical protein CFB39_37495 [Burkholderia sp. AU6039]